MDEKYKLVGVKSPKLHNTHKWVGDKGPELYDTGMMFSSYPLLNVVLPFTDDTIPMKITVEVRKFWFWWKA